jgi:hypothetical protein
MHMASKCAFYFFRLGIEEKDPSDLLKLYLMKHGKAGKRDGTVGIFSMRLKILPTVPPFPSFRALL